MLWWNLVLTYLAICAIAEISDLHKEIRRIKYPGEFYAERKGTGADRQAPTGTGQQPGPKPS